MENSDSSSSCDKMVHMNTRLDRPSTSANSSSTSLIGNDKELKSSTRFDEAVEKMNQTGDMLCDNSKVNANQANLAGDSEDMLVDDEHYEIEKILDKRVRNGVTEYLIRWKGYTEEYDTWEPEQNLCDTACESYVYISQ